MQNEQELRMARTNRNQPQYDYTPWWEKEEQEKRLRKENSFYTNGRQNGIIRPTRPRFNNLTSYQKAIDAKQEQLEDLHHQQYLHMTAGRKKEFDYINGPINHARAEKNALEAERSAVMGLGSNVSLRRDDTLPTLSKPSFEKGMLHAYGNIGAGIMAEQQRKAEAAHNGMLHAYGNIGDGLRMEQERKQREEHAYAIGTGGVSEPFDTSTGMGHAYESFGYDVKNESEVPEKRYPCPDHGIHKMHRITTIPVILSKKTKRPFAELGLSPSYFLCSCGEGVFCNSWPDVGPPLGYYLLKSETSTTFGWGMAVTVWADKEVLPWANTLPGFSFEN